MRIRPTRARTMRARPLATLVRAALVAGVGVSAPAAAIRIDYSFGLALEHSDNIARTEFDRVDDTVVVPSFSFDVEQEGARVRADAAGTIEYRNYLGDEFGDEVRANLASVLDWEIMPERLRWSFADYASVQPVSTFAPDTPDNLQQTNVFRTGPVSRWRLGSAAYLQGEALYTNSYAEETDEFDSNRYTGVLRYVRELDPLRSISANASIERVDFDQPTVFDYDRADVYGLYSTRNRRFLTDVLFGWTSLNLDGADDHDGPLLEVRLRTDPEQASIYRVTALHRWSDAARDLIVDPSEFGRLPRGPGSGVLTINGFVFEETALFFGYQHRFDRGVFRVDPFWRKQEYPDAPEQDLREIGVQAGYDHRLSPANTLGVSVGWEQRRYEGLSREDDQYGFTVRFERQQSRHWRFGVAFTHDTRDSSAPLQSYEDNRLIAYATWRR